MKVKGYKQFAGVHPETATLRNVLAHAGVVAPHTKKPFTEAMLMGVGGGLGAGYFSFQYQGLPPTVFIAARHGWMDHVAFMTGVCDRLGIKHEIKQTGSAKLAVKNLVSALEADRPAIVWGDVALLPYYGISPDLARVFPAVFVVFGYDADADQVSLADRSKAALTITCGELEAARASFGKAKNRVMTLEAPKKLADLKKAIKAGLKDCHSELTTHRMRNMRVDAFEKWAELVGSPKSKEGWPRAFAPGVPMHQGLAMAYLYIEVYGTGGGLLRPMYAAFLEEAAEVLSKSALSDLAAHYADLGKKWTSFARSLLPDRVPRLKQTRQLLDRYEKLRTGSKGDKATDEIRDVVQQLQELRAASQADFPFSEEESRAFYEKMEARLRELFELETEGLAKLKTLAK